MRLGAGDDIQASKNSTIIDEYNVLLLKALIASGSRKKLESARDLLERAPEESQDVETRLKLYLGLACWDKAAALVNQLEDGVARAFVEAEVAKGRGNNADAKKLLETVLERSDIGPEDRVRALVGLGQLEQSHGDSGKALSMYLQAAKVNQNDASPFAHLGRYYLAVNDLERAAKCFTRALTLKPR
jgi:tetratricopeptide (TPR) repeat protein